MNNITSFVLQKNTYDVNFEFILFIVEVFDNDFRYILTTKLPELVENLKKAKSNFNDLTREIAYLKKLNIKMTVLCMSKPFVLVNVFWIPL